MPGSHRFAREATRCTAGFYSFTAWRNARAIGADLLWRVKDNLKREPVKDLPGGSWLADVFDSTADRRRQHPVRVRVISYTNEDGRDPTGPFRLLTTVLDHRKAPAAQLAAAFDELKTEPPTRATRGTALEVTGSGHPGDLGSPVLPLRDTVPDVRHRSARRA